MYPSQSTTNSNLTWPLECWVVTEVNRVDDRQEMMPEMKNDIRFSMSLLDGEGVRLLHPSPEHCPQKLMKKDEVMLPLSGETLAAFSFIYPGYRNKEITVGFKLPRGKITRGDLFVKAAKAVALSHKFISSRSPEITSYRNLKICRLQNLTQDPHPGVRDNAELVWNIVLEA
ncbi:hypothetical protein NLI96_g9185 [Meripilus lineatus]|uniref:Uncharacterized protein n=1 Tax=Meripilus lineatus TaxID=2056292 RepID=A0AAD5YBA4_9APHY|nr:hypothetical protein NLI96_g9185 [Physisporinus lineatus]